MIGTTLFTIYYAENFFYVSLFFFLNIEEQHSWYEVAY